VQPLLPGCSFKAKDIPCESTRFTRKLFDWSDWDQSIVWTHANCVHNETIALSQRHQVDDGSRFNKAVFPEFMEKLMRLKKDCEPISKLAQASRYSGAKKRLALDAIEDLKVNALDIFKDSKVRMFIKDDKYHTPEVKPGRSIQFRSKRYAITLAQFTTPLEEKIFSHREGGIRVFAKGQNLQQRAETLRQMWDNYVNPVAWNLDHSKFDAHVSRELILAETKLYGECYENSGHKNYVKNLMRAQMINRGSTMNGTKFKTVATRMSGDQNTGLGNSVLNYAMISCVLKWCGVRANMYIDGDDSVVVMDQCDRNKVDAKLFGHFGMVTKSEFVDQFEHIDFCQTRPVWNGLEYILCRNPDRILSRINWLVRKQPSSIDSVYLKSVFLCESALNEGLPVMGPLFSRLASSIQTRKNKLMDVETDYQVKLLNKVKGRVYERECTYESRVSFEEAWGICPERQIELESMYTLSPADPMPLFYDLFPRTMEM